MHKAWTLSDRMAVAERLFLAIDLRLGTGFVDSHFQPIFAFADFPPRVGRLGGADARRIRRQCLAASFRSRRHPLAPGTGFLFPVIHRFDIAWPLPLQPAVFICGFLDANVFGPPDRRCCFDVHFLPGAWLGYGSYPFARHRHVRLCRYCTLARRFLPRHRRKSVQKKCARLWLGRTRSEYRPVAPPLRPAWLPVARLYPGGGRSRWWKWRPDPCRQRLAG